MVVLLMRQTSVGVCLLLVSKSFARTFLTLDTGMKLASLLELEFPNSESLSKALFEVVKVVEDYKLKGKWITACAGGTKDDLVTTPRICKVVNLHVNVNLFCLLFLIIAH